MNLAERFRKFWYRDDAAEMQRKMLRDIPMIRAHLKFSRILRKQMEATFLSCRQMAESLYPVGLK